MKQTESRNKTYLWQGEPKKWWKLLNRTIKIWGKKFYWENLCGVAHHGQTAGNGDTGLCSWWQYRQHGLNIVYCMAVCFFRWQYMARRCNGCIAWFSLNTAQTYKSKTNVLDVYEYSLFLSRFGFHFFLIRFCIRKVRYIAY